MGDGVFLLGNPQSWHKTRPGLVFNVYLVINCASRSGISDKKLLVLGWGLTRHFLVDSSRDFTNTDTKIGTKYSMNKKILINP